MCTHLCPPPPTPTIKSMHIVRQYTYVGSIWIIIKMDNLSCVRCSIYNICHTDEYKMFTISIYWFSSSTLCARAFPTPGLFQRPARTRPSEVPSEAPVGHPPEVPGRSQDQSDYTILLVKISIVGAWLRYSINWKNSKFEPFGRQRSLRRLRRGTLQRFQVGARITAEVRYKYKKIQYLYW